MGYWGVLLDDYSNPIAKEKNLRNFLSSDWPELGHMAIVSCKGGWDSEYLKKKKEWDYLTLM